MGTVDTLQEIEDTGVVVFQCENCNVIIGDSSSWMGINQDLRIMILGSAINVYQGSTLITSTEGADVGSTFVRLRCLSCKELLGKMYQTTHKSLDSIREKFGFDANKIKSYEVGSGNPPSVSGSHESTLSLPSFHVVVQQLQKMQGILVALNHRVSYLESLAPPDPGVEASQLRSNNTQAVAPLVRKNSNGVSQPNSRKTKADSPMPSPSHGKRNKLG